jgi:hypothetical protein
MRRRRGELGRIKDDQVEALTAALERAQFAEDVGLAPFGPARIELRVERQIVDGGRQGRPGGVDREDAAGAAGERLQRKSAGIAEAVERRAVGREFARQQAVVALVEVEARLVPGNDVDLDPDAVFDDAQRLFGRFAQHPAGDRL